MVVSLYVVGLLPAKTDGEIRPSRRPSRRPSSYLSNLSFSQPLSNRDACLLFR